MGCGVGGLVMRSAGAGDMFRINIDADAVWVNAKFIYTEHAHAMHPKPTFQYTSVSQENLITKTTHQHIHMHISDQRFADRCSLENIHLDLILMRVRARVPGQCRRVRPTVCDACAVSAAVRISVVCL